MSSRGTTETIVDLLLSGNCSRELAIDLIEAYVARCEMQAASVAAGHALDEVLAEIRKPLFQPGSKVP